MTDNPITGPSRRGFLRASVAAGGALVAGSAASAATPDPLITEIQPWAQGFGDGVDVFEFHGSVW
jgi:sulfane dehydrogenase subunit SoxC